MERVEPALSLTLAPDQPVVIRFDDVADQGKLLLTAGVMHDAGSSGD
ncbi:MAG: hypothetical protein HS126_33135 [Anaerolineales bacterium]|nr:hypothetical protein [Anaerolineales bacterium]